MSVQNQIERINSNVQNAISAIRETGVSVPNGANSNNLPELVNNLANEKQNKLSGKAGQFVSFDASGNAVAVNVYYNCYP